MCSTERPCTMSRWDFHIQECDTGRQRLFRARAYAWPETLFPPTFGQNPLILATAPTSKFGGCHLGRVDNAGRLVFLDGQRMPVTDHQVVSIGSYCAFQHPVVDVTALNHFCKPWRVSDGSGVLNDEGRLGPMFLVPTELGRQHSGHLFQDGPRQVELYPPQRADSSTNRSLPGKFRADTITLVSRTTLCWGPAHLRPVLFHQAGPHRPPPSAAWS